MHKKSSIWKPLAVLTAAVLGFGLFPGRANAQSLWETPWELTLVNPWNALPETFSPELQEVEDGQQMDVRVAPALASMLAAARAEGLDIVLCSGYRTHEQQRALFRNKVEFYRDRGASISEARRRAGRIIALPGTSEHETGLAADLMSREYPVLDEFQADTPEQRWLMAHAHEYGFILRYPRDKTAVTGIIYEPWHYRYVGENAAEEIFERGLCLEEYLLGRQWDGSQNPLGQYRSQPEFFAPPSPQGEKRRRLGAAPIFETEETGTHSAAGRKFGKMESFPLLLDKLMIP